MSEDKTEIIDEEFEDDEEDEPKKKSKKKGKKLWVYTLILAVIIIAGVLAYTQGDNLGSFGDKIKDSINRATGTAASVNGEKITTRELDLRYSQSLSSLESQGLDVGSEEQVKEAKGRILEGLIRERLVLQKADEQNISVGQEEIDEFYNGAVDNAGGEEAFNQLLSENNISAEQFRGNIENQLIAQEYIRQTVGEGSINATEEDVQVFYEQLQAQGAETPPLEEIRGDIVTYIEDQRLNQLLTSTIDQLEDEADIKIYF